MRKLFEQYFSFILYAITGALVLTLFLSIVEGPQLNYGLKNDETRDETSVKGEYEDINKTDVYFNIVGRPLVYGTNFNWNDYVEFDDGEPYKELDGTENYKSNHCFAIIKGQKIDLTSYVTPANYTNTTSLEIESHSFVNEKPKESEAKIEIVPYILNWENIHIKKNVAFFVLPNDMLMTFCGRAYNTSGVPFKNKRILYRKGETEMAQSQTDTNGYFVIGIQNETLPEGLNNSNIMPLGDYTFEVETGEGVYRIVYSENSFNDNQKIYQLGNITLS